MSGAGSGAGAPDEESFRRDLALVLDAADQWAGEYGFAPALRRHCDNVLEAVERLRGDYLPDDEEAARG